MSPRDPWRGKKPRPRDLARLVRRELGIPEGERGRWVTDAYGVRVWVSLRRVERHLGVRAAAGRRWRLIPRIVPVLESRDALVLRTKGRRVYRQAPVELIVKRTSTPPRGWHLTTLLLAGKQEARRNPPRPYAGASAPRLASIERQTARRADHSTAAPILLIAGLALLYARQRAA